MFLSKVKSNGNHYLYLSRYDSKEHYVIKRKTIYKFGRLEFAIKNMYEWREDFKKFPLELLELGCVKSDLEGWIKTMETGVTKTGRIFEVAI